jgi:hypothetical protein
MVVDEAFLQKGIERYDLGIADLKRKLQKLKSMNNKVNYSLKFNSLKMNNIRTDSQIGIYFVQNNL